MRSIERLLAKGNRFTEKELNFVDRRLREAEQNPVPPQVVEDIYGEVYPVRFKGGR